ncbi:MAG: hypothetical protein MK103_14970, partial [Planctomycetes bacterium]|nr:hypothetical protein [Planctomycetota bacterium]
MTAMADLLESNGLCVQVVEGTHVLRAQSEGREGCTTRIDPGQNDLGGGTGSPVSLNLVAH